MVAVLGGPHGGVGGHEWSVALSFQSLGDISLEAVLAGLALVGTLTLWLVDRFVFQRRQIAYRVQMDAPLHITPATAMVDFELRRHGSVVRDASLVLVRVDYVGGKDLEPKDIYRALSFRFPDRKILGLEITNAEPDDLKDMLLDGLVGDGFIGGDHIELPKIALNRGNSFKLLVLLTGSGAGMSHTGFLSGGGRGSGIRRDRRGRMPRGRGSVYATVSVGLAGILVGIFLIGRGPSGTPDYCVPGRLEIVGSSAFESMAKELRGAYVAECAAFRIQPDIEINMTGSRAGTKILHDRGERGERVDDVIAMSDGAADPNLNSLRGTPVAVLAFAVVVNDTAGVTSLSTDQLRDIYAGRLTNWSQLGGKDLPIRMVSRIGPDSGSRRTFQDKAINSSELGITSDDCERKDDPAAGYYRCEVGDTRELLENVDRIDGAIGYAELGMSRMYSRLLPMSIDTQEPSVDNITNGSYRFCAREFASTYRELPKDGSLAAEFLSYLNTENGSNILRGNDLILARDVPNTVCG